MSRDPAFLLYSSNFLAGTMFFTDDEVGKYFRALLAQHQNGHLSENQIQSIVKGNELVLSKFKKDKKGLYYNQRLEDEILKRNKYTEAQRANVLKRWYSNTDSDSIKDSNSNSNSRYNHGNTTVIPRYKYEIPLYLVDIFKDFEEMRKKIRRPLTEKAKKLIVEKVEKLSGGNTTVSIEIIKQSISNGWAGVFPLKQHDNPQNNFFSRSELEFQRKAHGKYENLPKASECSN